MGSSYARNNHQCRASIKSSHLQNVARDFASWENDTRKIEDPEGRERWALIAKFVALSSWFDVPKVSRHRGRPDVQESGSVSLALSLENIDRTRLSASKPLITSITMILKESISREAGGGILPGQVHLKFSVSTLMVQATIALSSKHLAASLRSRFESSQVLLRNVATSVQNIPGIDAVASGLIAARGLKISSTGASCRGSAPNLQSVTPVVSPPGKGAIGYGSPIGMSDLHLLRFQKIHGSAVPEEWRLATHSEVRSHMSEVLLLMSDWDIVGLASGWRFDGAGYGHNLKEPYGAVEFSMILVCRNEVGQAPLESMASNPKAPNNSANINAETLGSRTPVTSSPSGGSEMGALEKQQALDVFRRCWSPNEGDLENARRILRLQFMQHASVRQFGEPLLSRSDISRLLGRWPPPGLTESHSALSLLELGEIYDEVLEMQVVSTSFEGRALSKGLTFASLRIFLQKIALALGLHFRHIVDDAVDANAEVLRE
jgi:hypothetical protein